MLKKKKFKLFDFQDISLTNHYCQSKVFKSPCLQFYLTERVMIDTIEKLSVTLMKKVSMVAMATFLV